MIYLPLLISTAVAILAVGSKLWNKMSQSAPLSTIPNIHFSAPYSSLFLTFLKFTGREHRTRYAAHIRCGPVVRVAPNEVSINCIQDGVQTVYGGGFEKGAWYQNFSNYGKPFMFTMGHTKEHSERKRMLAHVYSKSFVQSSTELTKILDMVLHDRALPIMRRLAKDNTIIDIQKENKAFTMDVSTAYFFGRKNGTNFVQNIKQKALLRDFELGMSGLFWLAEAPGLVKWCSRFGIKLLSDKVMSSYQIVQDLCAELCDRAKEEHIESNGSHPNVYTQLRQKLQASHGVREEDLDVTIAAEMMDHMQAGHEGTGITLTFLMCELSRNPLELARLRQELGALGKTPTAHEVDSLPFLDAIFMETMRRYPGAFGPFPRYVPETGANLCGFKVPGGTTVSASVYCLHRNATVFPDPEMWRPERWIGISDKEKREMLRWFWVFGSGGRMCIGSHLALRMMKTYIVAFYNELDTFIVSDTIFDQVDGLMGAPVGDVVNLGVREIPPKRM
ncbi:cytochrome P450 [Amylocarpus encephaloides]|uniref:Cytochrome P450 n=1 Tax=Amylocarpus encephaloides TaxID=45428 RepID=A0A9P7Y774_9HELO|nr:cytochrome P450 [Amylocarpus encephaloides]